LSIKNPLGANAEGDNSGTVAYKGDNPGDYGFQHLPKSGDESILGLFTAAGALLGAVEPEGSQGDYYGYHGEVYDCHVDAPPLPRFIYTEPSLLPLALEVNKQTAVDVKGQSYYNNKAQ
jgi:hypothetical protein